jgi:hypothetical protein
MATPAIGILLEVFIGKCIFKRATMQVEGHNITRGEPILRQVCQEQFVDDPITSHSHSTFARRCRMCGDHDPARLLRRTQSQARTIVESTLGPAFGMGEVLIGRQVQTGLDLRSLEQLIVFAAHDIHQPC